MAAINFTLSDELLAQVDQARGDVPRVRWIRRAVEQALGDVGTPQASSPAPAERPRGLFRSSAQAKREVKPIPKGGSK